VLVDGIGIREAVNPGSLPAARQRAMITQAVGGLAAHPAKVEAGLKAAE
jgi:hypothetical protein